MLCGSGRRYRRRSDGGGGVTLFLMLGGVLLAAAAMFDVANADCPNWCSQKGLCTGPGKDAFCVCEWGHTGADCSVSMCPKGDDPLTVDQSYREIIMTTSASKGRLDGLIDFSFNSQTVTFQADAELVSSYECTQLIQALPNVQSAVCSRGSVDAHGGAQYRIAFTSWPYLPHENNLYMHDGNPLLDDFACNTSQVTGGASQPTCELEDSVGGAGDAGSTNMREYTYCSNHGTCDFNSGKCACSPGFKGLACDDMRDDEDELVTVAPGPFFTAAVHRLTTYRERSQDFDMIVAAAAHGNDKLMSLHGDGSLDLPFGPLTVGGNLVLQEGGGLEVQGKGGATIADGGMAVSTRQPNADHAMAVAAEDLAFSGTALRVRAARGAAGDSPDGGFNLIRASTADGEAFTVTGDGRTVVHSGGLSVVRGGAHVEAGDVRVERGKVRAEGGAVVDGDGLSVEGGGVTVGDGGLVISEGGAAVVNSARTQPAMTIVASDAEFSSDALLIVAKRTPSPEGRPSSDGEKGGGAYRLISAQNEDGAPAFEVASSGGTSIHGGGLRVHSGGVSVGSGGAVIDAGGLSVDGGVHIRSGGLTMEGSEGFGIIDGGLSAQALGDAGTALTARVTSEHYRGSAVKIEAAGSVSASGEVFTLLEATAGPDGREVFTLDGRGAVRASGSITGGEPGGDSRDGVISNGDLVARTRAVLARASVPAGDTIRLPSGHSFIVITNDRAGAANRLEMPAASSANPDAPEYTAPGQLLLVYNSDETPTTGDAPIPARSAVLFVFDGTNWQDIGGLDASVLSSVTSFTAASDLDIGPHSLRAKHILADAQLPASVAFYAAEGRLASDGDFMFAEDPNTGLGLLSVPSIGAHSVTGTVNFKGNVVADVAIRGGTIEDIAAMEVGKLAVGSQAKPLGSGDAQRLAFFGDRGALTADDSLHYSPQAALLSVDKLAASALAGDVDCGGHTLTDVAIAGKSSIEGVETLKLSSLETESVKVNSQREGGDGGSSTFPVAFFDADGTLSGNREKLSFDDETGLLSVPNLHVESITADSVDFDGRAITNVRVEGGSVTGVSQVTTDAITVPNQPSGRVPFFGDGGEMQSESSLTFDPVEGTLTPLKLGPHSVTGAVNFDGNALVGASISGGTIESVKSLSAEDVTVTGGLGVGQDTYIGGNLAVSGSVMGSGAYVDSSDARFKTAIENLAPKQALEAVDQLRPVTYSFLQEDFPERNFPGGAQLGFIAQEVEQVVPELVTTDEDGWKALAYAHMTPVLAGAVQELSTAVKELREANRVLSERVVELEQRLAS